MGIEDYVAVAKDISLELLDRIEKKHLVDYRDSSLHSSKIEAVQKAYENWMKAIILSEIIPSLWNFNNLAGNASKAVSVINDPNILGSLDAETITMIELVKPLVESQGFLQQFQTSFMDPALNKLIVSASRPAINDFLMHKLNHDLHWFFDYTSKMQGLEQLLPPVLDNQGNRIERGSAYTELVKDVDANKPCLMRIHENQKFKQVLSLLKQKPDGLEVTLPLPSGPELQKKLNSINHHLLISIYASLYASLIVKCLKKYQNEPRFTASEDANMDIELKYIPLVVEILENNYKQDRLFIDKLIPYLSSYRGRNFSSP